MDQAIVTAINLATKPNLEPQTPTKSTIKPLSLKFKALALECGFIFWGDEPHGPGPGNIDWSCDYTEEFEEYSCELVRWTCETMEQELTYASSLAAQKTYQHLAV